MNDKKEILIPEFTEIEKSILALSLCGFIIRNPFELEIAEKALSIAKKLNLYQSVIADIESFKNYLGK